MLSILPIRLINTSGRAFFPPSCAAVDFFRVELLLIVALRIANSTRAVYQGVRWPGKMHGFGELPGKRMSGSIFTVTVDIERMRENSRTASVLLKAMGNEDRLLVLCHLLEGEKSVSELAGLVNVSQSSISQHLNRLERDNLVSRRRLNQRLFYSLTGSDVPVILEALEKVFTA